MEQHPAKATPLLHGKFRSRKYIFTLCFLLFLASIIIALVVAHIALRKDNTALIISLTGTMWAVISAYFFANVQQKNLLSRKG
jgi:membrane associated rhomboid family serine protease